MKTLKAKTQPSELVSPFARVARCFAPRSSGESRIVKQPARCLHRIPLVAAIVFALHGFTLAQGPWFSITAQPQSQTNVLGDAAILSVSAEGEVPALYYQWYKNYVPVPGATSSIFSFTNLVYADAGNYYVEVTDFTDTIASDIVVMTVIPPPPGELDLTFDPGSGANGPVYCVAEQSDGKVLIGGSFDSVNGTIDCHNIARLNTDGSLDADFQSHVYLNGTVYSMAIQPNGKILIGGDFSVVNEWERNCLARLNADGSLDEDFLGEMDGIEFAWNSAVVLSIALQPDGKVLIGGNFNSVNGEPRNDTARLHADGSVDANFLDGIDEYYARVESVAVQDDGKVLFGGSFTTANGISHNGLRRFSPAGILEAGFTNRLAETGFDVKTVVLQDDGRILIGGPFSSIDGENRNGIARLNIDGSLDTDFLNGMAGASSEVKSVVVQSDSKILIGGDFTMVNGNSRSRIARLDASGALDAIFLATLDGANSAVHSMAIQSDGNILIGGEFTMVNGVECNRIARLYGNEPAVDTDGDGLNDWDEFAHGTDPENPDSDGDGMLDGWEYDHGLDPLDGSDAGLDGDDDGVVNIFEFLHGGDPGNTDSDGDGLDDYAEIFVHGTDPSQADSDGDGVDDATEVSAGTDPLSAGTTGGIRYYYDDLDRIAGVDCANGLSLTYGYDGNNNLLTQTWQVRDANSNGISDVWEELNGTPADRFADSDGDGFTDGQEWDAGTDPLDESDVPEDVHGTVGSSIIDPVGFPFTPDRYVVGVGQLDGIGGEEIVIGADGDPGTQTNFIMILTQESSGWTTQRVDVGSFGVNSIAVGQPANRPSPAIYIGLLPPDGYGGQLIELIREGNQWVQTWPLGSESPILVLGVRPGRDVMIRDYGDPHYLSYESSSWKKNRADSTSSASSLGCITPSGLHGLPNRGVRQTYSGKLQVLGDDGYVPDYNRVWYPELRQWYFLTPTTMNWPAAQEYARRQNGHLATVYDDDLNTWLAQQFGPTTSYNYWIGLQRHSPPDDWAFRWWASGEPYDYENWDDGQPDNGGNHYEYYTHVRNSSGEWNDISGDSNYRGVVELYNLCGPTVSTNEPSHSTLLPWEGRSLCAGDLRLTDAVSIFSAAVEDGNTFLLTEYLFDGDTVWPNTTEQIDLPGTSLSSSYGLTCKDLLYDNRQALFTAEPDGNVFMWSVSYSTAGLQRRLFSDAYEGSAWHALAAVETAGMGESLLGVRVDPTDSSRCDLILWDPLTEPPAEAAGYPQTAPVAQVLPQTSTSLVAEVGFRLWDAENNKAAAALQYRLPGVSEWQDAEILSVDGFDPALRVTAAPTGSPHELVWDATGLFPETTPSVLLRVRGEDVTLAGEWSAPVEYMMPYTLTDGDGDGLPDAWEILYFGSTNHPHADADRDPDGDGQNNRAEYLCGTHPDNWNSCLRIISISQETGDHINIAWQTAGGKTNRVQAALTPGGVYENVSPSIIISGSGDTTIDWTELSGATNSPARFYRIWLQP